MSIFRSCKCVGLALATMTFIAATPPVLAARGGCLNGPEVQAAIRSQKIRTWPAIRARAGIAEKYRIVGSIEVCLIGGTPYYVVGVSGPSGDTKKLHLNAITGARR